jgi:hypothetical protein
MALASFDQYLQKLRDTHPSSFPSLSSRYAQYGTWTVNGGVAPTASVALTKVTTGAQIPQIPDTGDQFLQVTTLGHQMNSGILVGVPMITDRLVHSGGLVANITTEQTTNLPTAALPRYTDGIGVMIGLDVYTATGSTATTVTARYTNQDGTAGRVTQAVVWPASAPVGRRYILPLQDGDTGVRSVEGVTFAGSTATAGNVGVTLFKPLGWAHSNMMHGGAQWGEAMAALYGGLFQVHNDACIEFLSFGGSSSTQQYGSIKLIGA